MALVRNIAPSRNSVLLNSRSNSVITPLFHSNDHEESDDDLRKEDISFSVADSGPLTPGKESLECYPFQRKTLDVFPGRPISLTPGALLGEFSGGRTSGVGYHSSLLKRSSTSQSRASTSSIEPANMFGRPRSMPNSPR
jgi:hypothetical protein